MDIEYNFRLFEIIKKQLIEENIMEFVLNTRKRKRILGKDRNRNGKKKNFKGTKRYQIFKRDGFRCLCCGEKDIEKLTIDHIKPISWGKDNNAKNLQTLCKDCNNKKGDTKIDYKKIKQQENACNALWTEV